MKRVKFILIGLLLCSTFAQAKLVKNLSGDKLRVGILAFVNPNLSSFWTHKNFSPGQQRNLSTFLGSITIKIEGYRYDLNMDKGSYQTIDILPKKNGTYELRLWFADGSSKIFKPFQERMPRLR